MSSIDGMRKAKVLPLPVLAAASTSLQSNKTITVKVATTISYILVYTFTDALSAHVKSVTRFPPDSPSFQQGTNTFVLDFGHVFEAHLLHSFQSVLAHQVSQRDK